MSYVGMYCCRIEVSCSEVARLGIKTRVAATGRIDATFALHRAQVKLRTLMMAGANGLPLHAVMHPLRTPPAHRDSRRSDEDPAVVSR